MYLRLIILFLITLSPLILSGQHTEIEEDPLFQEKEDSNLLNNEIETDEIIHRVFISPIVIRPEIDSVQFHADISDIDVSEVEIEIENKCGNLIRLKALPDEKYQGNIVGHIYSTKKYDLFEGCSSEINPIGDRIFRSEYHANIINSAEAIADNQIIEHYEFDRERLL